MTINFLKNNTVPAQSIWNRNDLIDLAPLVIPDQPGPWGLRYIWIKHRENNDEFVNGYFKDGSSTGLNVRKQTAHLQPAWESHNKIFDESKESGKLVWRVKVFNTLSMTIDYVEVWQSPQILTELWGDGKALLETKSHEELVSLSKGLYESGFDVRSWKEKGNRWATVSKDLAIDWYHHFVNKWRENDNCIINTPWNKILHPKD